MGGILMKWWNIIKEGGAVSFGGHGGGNQSALFNISYGEKEEADAERKETDDELPCDN